MKLLKLLIPLNEFGENRLDKFWSDQEVLYNYKTDLQGIRNHSIV